MSAAAKLTPADLPIRDDLRSAVPYGAPQLDVAVRLNTNENPHPPSAQLAARIGEAVQQAALGLQRYPDRDALLLRRDLAGYLSAATGARLSTDQIWAANGSNEVLQQLLQAFAGPGRSALGFEPSYSMHRLLARGTGTRYLTARRGPDFALTAALATAAIREFRPDVIFVCSPNNPTGTAVGLDVIDALYREVESGPAGIVIVDEAYAEFSACPSAVTLLPGRPRLVVTRTMSKAFAFAGARVGYLAADPAVVNAVQLVRLPYHLSALTQVAAREAIASQAELQGAVADLKGQRDRIVRRCRELGCAVADSDANFVLFGGFADQARVWQQLLDRGVLVRDVGLPGWLRVTAGTETETTAFLDALEAVLKDTSGTDH